MELTQTTLTRETYPLWWKYKMEIPLSEGYDRVALQDGVSRCWLAMHVLLYEQPCEFYVKNEMVLHEDLADYMRVYRNELYPKQRETACSVWRRVVRMAGADRPYADSEECRRHVKLGVFSRKKPRKPRKNGWCNVEDAERVILGPVGGSGDTQAPGTDTKT